MAITTGEMIKTSDLLVKALENEGVEFLFGIPGEENLDFLESLRASDQISLVLTRHEQAAGFMAATVGRLTGRIGVCLSTLGPGATNLTTAAAFAHLGGMPMMMVTGQKPIRDSKQGSFQIIDVPETMRPVTKFTTQVSDGNVISSIVRKATRIATTERQGPVHIELPEDIARGKAPDVLFPVTALRRPVAERKAIARAVEVLKGAKLPLLMIGAGANRQRSVRALRQFVDDTGIPFFTTQMGKGVIDERHSLYLGCAALSSKDYLHVAIDMADVIVNVGHDTMEKPPFLMDAKRGKTARKVIHINFYPALVDNVYFPQVEVVGDIANAIWEIKEELWSSKIKFNVPVFTYLKEQVDSLLEAGTTDDSYPMNIARVVKDLRSIMPDDGIVSLDNGYYKIWFARLYQAYLQNTLLLDNALATMGAGLPNAIAASMLYPDKKIVAVAGDGGFMMNSAEIMTAVQYKVNLTLLVLNDNAFGMIEWKQNTMGFDKWGLGLQNPDFVSHAKSFGAQSHRISSAEDFQKTVKHCMDTGGVHVVEVPISYDWATAELKKIPGVSQQLAKECVEKFGSIVQLRDSHSAITDPVKPKASKQAAKKPAAKKPSAGSSILKRKQKATSSASATKPRGGSAGAGGTLKVTQGATLPIYVASKPMTTQKTIDVLDKYTNKPYCKVCVAGPEELEAAIEAATASARRMAKLKAFERKAILMNIVDQAKTRFEELAMTLCIEAGKPIKDSRGEVQRFIETFTIAAEETTRIYGEYQPLDISARGAPYQGITRRFPVGPCSLIVPFNFPLNLLAHKLAACIAAGNTCVIKAASKTPISALIVGDILANEPLMPEGAFSVVTVSREAADVLTVDERFKVLSFTGSPAVGWMLKEKAGKKKVLLELGGNAACVVDEIVPNMATVVKQIVSGGYYQSGQSCIGVQRLFVNSDIYEDFKAAFVEAVSALKSGDPKDEKVFIGPVISENDAKRCHDWVTEAEAKGGTVLTGGTHNGVIMEATIVENCPHDVRLWKEEVFGPVVCLESYDGTDFRDIIEKVNDSDFGLQAGVYTTDLNKAWYAFENIDAGGVLINQVPSYRIDSQPYGGNKDAGNCREGLRYAIEDMTELKIMIMNGVGDLDSLYDT